MKQNRTELNRPYPEKTGRGGAKKEEKLAGYQSFNMPMVFAVAFEFVELFRCAASVFRSRF